MDRDLSHLSPAEIQLLQDAFSYITILIAGADGNIDQDELSWAEKVAHIRTYAGDERLEEFHKSVHANIEPKINELRTSLPQNVEERSKIISDYLTGLNPVLAKIDHSVAAILYKGYRRFALRIARASGGVMSFFSVGSAEKKYVDLPMITPVISETEGDFDPDKE